MNASLLRVLAPLLGGCVVVLLLQRSCSEHDTRIANKVRQGLQVTAQSTALKLQQHAYELSNVVVGKVANQVGEIGRKEAEAASRIGTHERYKDSNYIDPDGLIDPALTHNLVLLSQGADPVHTTACDTTATHCADRGRADTNATK